MFDLVYEKELFINNKVRDDKFAIYIETEIVGAVSNLTNNIRIDIKSTAVVVVGGSDAVAGDVIYFGGDVGGVVFEGDSEVVVSGVGLDGDVCGVGLVEDVGGREGDGKNIRE